MPVLCVRDDGGSGNGGETRQSMHVRTRTTRPRPLVVTVRRWAAESTCVRYKVLEISWATVTSDVPRPQAGCVETLGHRLSRRIGISRERH